MSFPDVRIFEKSALTFLVGLALFPCSGETFSTSSKMLFTEKTIAKLAETLEGIAVGAKSVKGSVDASILIFHPENKNGVPLVELALTESKKTCRTMIQSPLGVVELAEVEEVTVSTPTKEVAFFAKERGGKTTMVTVSSYGVLQVYSQISKKLADKDISKIDGEDLRAAIALKVFAKKSKKK